LTSKKQKKELKKVLLERKLVIENTIKDGIDNISKLNNCDCKDDMDFAESCSDSFTSGIIVKQQQEELKEINEALKNMESSGYGICQMCDEEIEFGRLQAKPFAKYCTTCREIHENNK